MGLVSVLWSRNSSLGPTCYNNTDEIDSENSLVSSFTHYLIIKVSKNILILIRWGRGHPEEYTEAINLGGDDSRYDPMDDKKPRAGQILWIRGLTRLQTQVSNVKNLPLSPSHSP